MTMWVVNQLNDRYYAFMGGELTQEFRRIFLDFTENTAPFMDSDLAVCSALEVIQLSLSS